MSTQNDYTDTLKRIKGIEEQSSAELEQTKKSLEDELRRLEEEYAKSIEAAREKAEKDQASQVEVARIAAQLDANQVLASAQKGSSEIASKKLDHKDLKKLIDDVVLAEFREG